MTKWKGDQRRDVIVVAAFMLWSAFVMFFFCQGVFAHFADKFREFGIL